MCGIVAMISNKRVCKETVKCLCTLEHRGTYSSGMVSYNSNKGEFSTPIRAPGSASQVFGNIKLPFDNVAIGHNRYATSGHNQIKDIQPMYYARPGMALAHNGQIANYSALKQKLKKKGYSFFTNNDSEVLMFALAQNLRERKFYETKTTEEFVKEKLFPALKDIMDPESEFHIVGAYSVIVIIADYGLLAFKDPHGIRPLSLAKKIQKSKNIIKYVLASETTAFHILKGYNSYRELEPGEAVFIDFDHNIYWEKINRQQPKICPFEMVYFSQIDSNFQGTQVYDIRKKLGQQLAKYFAKLKKRIDVVMPIPKSPIPSAQALAKVWNKEYGGIVALPAYSSIRSFQKTINKDRKRVASEKLLFVRSHIKGKRIGLVDDSVVRGNTSKTVIRKLFELGAKEVHLFSTFPPFKHICPGGIDIAHNEELLMHKKNINQACKYIKATTLNFLPLKLMLEAVNLTRKTACLGCTEEKYPFDMSDYKNFQKLR